MQELEKLLTSYADFVWGPPLLILLLGTHLFLTFRLRFIQRYIGLGIKLSLERKQEGQGDVSQFGALTTALAATIGTGNIIGVGTAISVGGPGAVLWMWLTGVFGIATKYAEALLSVKYRTVNAEGNMAGGPMYVLDKGMNLRWLGVAFAALTAVAAFGIGNMVQANSISSLLEKQFALPTWVSGIVMAVITAAVILGGIKSIARVCELLVPFMAIFYVGGCLFILLKNIGQIPETIRIILSGAFTGQAAVGGFVGAGVLQAMRFGVARGLFSNESGLGSAPIVAASAQTRNPVRQALVSSTGTFWDTVVVCLVTGLVLVNSGDWQTGLKGDELTYAAFRHIPYIGQLVLSIGLLTFVFSTILGWSYYGEKAIEYLFGLGAVKPYRYLWVAFVFVGSISSLKAVWAFADIANGLMAIPNLVSLLVLSSVVVRETQTYLWTENAINNQSSPEPTS
ncbi:MAG TPA: sodium:alanine symporter family protein [Candidatus Ozemobacteraceae bacterium]|nr:sodium:alanine symporter family protein [Candidatus Ozemobacteraceae bacterium]